MVQKSVNFPKNSKISYVKSRLLFLLLMFSTLSSHWNYFIISLFCFISYDNINWPNINMKFFFWSWNSKLSHKKKYPKTHFNTNNYYQYGIYNTFLLTNPWNKNFWKELSLIKNSKNQMRISISCHWGLDPILQEFSYLLTFFYFFPYLIYTNRLLGIISYDTKFVINYSCSSSKLISERIIHWLLFFNYILFILFIKIIHKFVFDFKITVFQIFRYLRNYQIHTIYNRNLIFS